MKRTALRWGLVAVPERIATAVAAAEAAALTYPADGDAGLAGRAGLPPRAALRGVGRGAPAALATVPQAGTGIMTGIMTGKTGDAWMAARVARVETASAAGGGGTSLSGVRRPVPLDQLAQPQPQPAAVGSAGSPARHIADAMARAQKMADLVGFRTWPAGSRSVGLPEATAAPVAGAGGGGEGARGGSAGGSWGEGGAEGVSRKSASVWIAHPSDGESPLPVERWRVLARGFDEVALQLLSEARGT